MKNLNYSPDTATETRNEQGLPVEKTLHEKATLTKEKLKGLAEKEEEKQAKVVQLRQETVEGASQPISIAKESEGTVFQLPKKEEKEFSLFSNAKTALTKAMAFIGLFAATQGNAQNNTKITEKDLQAKKEIKATGEQRIVSKGIPVYAGGKTEQGRFTPTGYSNSFYENQYGLTPKDLKKIAKFYNFPENEEGFQDAMYDYVEENNPELLDEVDEIYGQNAAGVRRDKKLGVRDAFVAFHLLKKIPTPSGGSSVEIVHTKPKKDSIPSTIDSLPSPEQEWGKSFKLKGFKKLLLLIDGSPSNAKHVRNVLNIIIDNNKDNDVPVSIAKFTKGIDATSETSNLNDALSSIRETDFENGGTVELIFDNVITQPENYKGTPGEATAMIAESDEVFAGGSIKKFEKIRGLAEEENVVPLFIGMKNGALQTFTLDQVEEKWKENYKKFGSTEKQIAEKEAEVKHWEDMIGKRIEKIQKNTLEIQKLGQKIMDNNETGKALVQEELMQWERDFEKGLDMKKIRKSNTVQKEDFEKFMNYYLENQELQKQIKELGEELNKKRSDREKLNEGDVYYT